MPSEHANLSPSSASRWLQCPASIRMSEGIEDTESAAAREGTLAHALGEIEVRLAFNQLTPAEYETDRAAWKAEVEAEGYSHDALVEMEACVEDYVDLVRERASRVEGTLVFVERRVNTGVPDSWGTSDIILVSPEHVEIIDLKYGKGVKVEAARNPQLRLYGLGALDEYGDILGEPKTITATVFQPRLDHLDSETLPVEALRFWRDEIATPGALEALSPNARFGPSESACRWCPAAGICRARTEAIARDEFGDDPDRLTPEEVGEWLGRFPEIRDWMKAVEAEALDALYERGEEIPGWKAVLSGGQRKIVNPRKAIELLEMLGYDREDLVDEKIAGLGALDKLVGGKENLAEILGEVLGRTEGRPSLAPDTDKRRPVSKVDAVLDEFD